MKFGFRQLFRPRPLSAQAAYDLWAHDYATVSNPIKTLSDEFVQSVVTPNAPCVVDIGCGTGDHLRWARQNGAGQVIGIDASNGMIRKAAEHRDNRVDLIMGQAERLPVSSCCTQIIICALVAGHFRDLERAIGEMHRILRPDGHLILTDFHYDAARRGDRRTFESDGKIHSIEHTVHDASTYKRTLSNAGFLIRRITDFNYQGRPVVLGIHATRLAS